VDRRGGGLTPQLDRTKEFARERKAEKHIPARQHRITKQKGKL
jgi:hypothetical protein